MYIEINGKVVESKIITIGEIGQEVKDYVIKKVNSNSNIIEIKVINLRELVLNMESEIKDSKIVADEAIILLAEQIEKELKYEINILSDTIRAIFYLGDGSNNNKLIALEQIRSVLDITWIEIMKAKTKRN